MTITLEKAEAYRETHASTDTFVWIGGLYGYMAEVLYENLSGLVDYIGYRELELAPTQCFLDYWEGYAQAGKDLDYVAAEGLDLSDLPTFQTILSK